MGVVYQEDLTRVEGRETAVIPDYVLTISETASGPIVRPYAESDLAVRALEINVFPDASTGAQYLAQEVAGTLAYETMRTGSIVTAVMPSDTTHDTGNPGFYGAFGGYARALGLNLAHVRWLHLDNYWYPQDVYPARTDRHDFAHILRKKFIDPNGIDPASFYPIQSQGDDPQRIAYDYEQVFRSLKPKIGVFGIGPVPDCHLAYIPPGMPFDAGYSHVPISPSTTARNHARGEFTPGTAITMGPANIRSLAWKFVTSWKNPEVTERTFLGDISPDAVGTMLRRPEYRNGTRVFLNRTAAEPLLEQLAR
jgi:hypothetical protein